MKKLSSLPSRTCTVFVFGDHTIHLLTHIALLLDCQH